MKLFKGKWLARPIQESLPAAVVGRGPAAEAAAGAIEAAGWRTEVIDQVKSIVGLPGYFRLQTAAGHRWAGAVVLTENRPAPAPWPEVDRLAVVVDPSLHPDPAWFGQLLDRAMDFPGRVFLFCGQAKVAGPDLSTKYRAARQAGVLVTRLAAGPEINPTDQGARLSFSDPVLADDVELTVGAVVSPRPWTPSPELSAAVTALGLIPGPDGYPAPDNVLFPAPRTSRAGVFAPGLAGGRPDDWDRDIDLLLAELPALLAADPAKFALSLNSDRGECAECLTCLRVCPVGAIGWLDGPAVNPVACLQCGQCVAVCPVRAIRPDWVEEKDLIESLIGPGTEPGAGTALLICNRAPDPDPVDLPAGVKVIKLACAGRVDDLVLAGLIGWGYERILIAGCHNGNCRSLDGADKAAASAERTAGLIERLQGNRRPDGDRIAIRFIRLAPNQPHILAQALAEVTS